MTSERAVITLAPAAAGPARELAERLGIGLPETVRRGLGLLRLWAELPDGAYLAVVNADKSIERVVML